MKIILEFLVVALISAIPSVAVAQAPKTTNATKLSAHDVAKIKRTLATNKYIQQGDSVNTVILLNNNNTPQGGFIDEDEEIISQSKKGDVWIVFISRQNGCLWLTYVVKRDERFIGQLDVRIE